MQESGWKPRWFAKDKDTDTYRYLGGYWESREKSSWEGCPDIFGQVPNDLMITDQVRVGYRSFGSLCWDHLIPEILVVHIIEQLNGR